MTARHLRIRVYFLLNKLNKSNFFFCSCFCCCCHQVEIQDIVVNTFDVKIFTCIGNDKLLWQKKIQISNFYLSHHRVTELKAKAENVKIPRFEMESCLSFNYTPTLSMQKFLLLLFQNFEDFCSANDKHESRDVCIIMWCRRRVINLKKKLPTILLMITLDHIIFYFIILLRHQTLFYLKQQHNLLMCCKEC